MTPTRTRMAKKPLTVILALVLVALLTVAVYALEVYEIPHTVEIPDGAYGVFQIPSIGTDSPLYQGRDYQGIIDDEDSALLYKYKRGWLVADHSGSEVGDGYWYVEDIRVGSGAFLIREGQPEIAYFCTAVYFCHQNGWNYAYHGQNVNPTANGMMCVSCSEVEDWVYVAVFEYVGEMP